MLTYIKNARIFVYNRFCKLLTLMKVSWYENSIDNFLKKQIS